MTIRPHAPPPKWSPERSSFDLDLRLVAVFGVFVLLILLVLARVLSPYVAIGMASVVTAIVAIGVLLRKKRIRAFEREFAPLLQHSAERAESFMNRSWYIRIFAPRSVLLPRRGLIALKRGELLSAERFFERAWLTHEREDRNRLLGPLVRAKAGLGRWGDVLVLAGDWVSRSMTPESARVYLSAATLKISQSEADRRQAKEVLEQQSGGLSTHARELREQLLSEGLPDVESD